MYCILKCYYFKIDDYNFQSPFRIDYSDKLIFNLVLIFTVLEPWRVKPSNRSEKDFFTEEFYFVKHIFKYG